MPPFEHAAAFGYDGTNDYYNFLARVAEEMPGTSVMELGTCTGGSTSYLAAAGAASVISVDIWQQPARRERLTALTDVELRERDTTDPTLADVLGKWCCRLPPALQLGWSR
jgi:predicted O-methyltransferase YrrM